MDRDLSHSRAILIGNAVYRPDSGILPLPAAVSCVTAMAELLTGDMCGWPRGRVVSLVDVASPSQLARQIISAVKDVQDTVLVYYIGHGLRTFDGQLALALADTDSDAELLPHTAILYEAIARILRGCPAATKLVILDCCHAELGTRANYVFQSSDDIAEEYPVDGLYFIGASRIHQKAKAPIGGNLTYFTQYFVDTVRDGIPGGPEWLRLDQIFVALRGRLVRANLPMPVESGMRGAYQYPFARNRAAHLGPNASSVQPDTNGIGERVKNYEAVGPDRARINRLVAAAVHAAYSVDDSGERASAVARVAEVVAATDPDRAGRLIADAERLALSISKDDWRVTALAGVAEVVAATDPDRAARLIADASRLAQSITDKGLRATALASVAEVVAATDPDLAERLARSPGGSGAYAWTLARIAEVVAATDPERAERLALSITDNNWKQWAIGGVARVVAATDPDHAERLAQSITNESWKAATLAGVAKAVAATDPDRAARLTADAERLAQSITGTLWRASALVGIAGAVAATDPGRAEHLALSITDDSEKAHALADVAEAVAATDPGRAERLVLSIDEEKGRTPRRWKTLGLTRIAKIELQAAQQWPDHSRADQARVNRVLAAAVRAAYSFSGGSSRAAALAGVAEAVALPTRIVRPGSSPTRNVSPSRSPTRATGHAHWPGSRRRWPLPPICAAAVFSSRRRQYTQNSHYAPGAVGWGRPSGTMRS